MLLSEVLPRSQMLFSRRAGRSCRSNTYQVWLPLVTVCKSSERKGVSGICTGFSPAINVPSLL